MKRWRKLLICLLSAIYLITSYSGNPVYAREIPDSTVKQAEPGNETKGDEGYSVEDIVHGQHAWDGNNEMTVTLVDKDIQWLPNGDHFDAVKKALHSDINKDATAMLFQYKIEINLDEHEYVNYQKDGVCITIPRTILQSYNSYTQSNPVKSLDNGVGIFQIDNLFNVSSGFTYKVVGDKIQITNRGVLQSRTIEITLSYKPDKMSYYYPDYNPGDLESCASLPFLVNLSLTSSSGNTATLEAEAPCVYIDTNAQISLVEKTFNKSWLDVVTEGNEEIQYLYVQFKVHTEMKSEAYKYPTQAYNFNIEDVFNGHADIHYGDENLNDFEWQLVGWYSADSPNPDVYSTTRYFKSSSPQTSTSFNRYVLFKVKQPETMYADYVLNNEATVYAKGNWGVDDQTQDDDDAAFSQNWHNTSPYGRYFVHNWGNTNWTSSAHKRTPVGKSTIKYNEHHWENANRELDRFANQWDDIYGDPVTELRGLRYWSWYEGYPSLGQTTVNKVKFVCENKDLVWNKSSSYSLTPSSFLGADKYFLKELGFYVEAKYATHNGTYWVVNKNVDPFADDHEPIYVYGLVDGRDSSNWKLLVTVNYNAQTKRWDNIEINQAQASNVTSASYTSFEGENEYFTGHDYGVFIEFANQNIYGYRIENVNEHYYFFVGARANYSLKSTETTRDYCGAIGGNHSKEYWLWVYDYADMDIYDWNYPDEETESTNNSLIKAGENPKAAVAPGTRVFKFSTTDSKVDRIAGDIAAGENNMLHSYKRLLETEQQSDLNRYRSRWKLQGYSYVYGSVSIAAEYYPVRRIPMQKGVFYDVLPRNAVLEDMDNLKNSIKVYKSPLWTWDYVEDAQIGWDNNYLIKNAQYGAEIDEMFLMSPDDYEVELYTDTFNNKRLDGLMVLVVRINKQSDPYVGTLPHSATWQNLSGGYTVVFDTYTPYSALNKDGSRIVNAMCFEALNGFSYKERAYADNPNDGVRDKDKNPLEPLSTSNFADYNKILSLLTNVDPNTNDYIFSYDYDETTASYDTIAQSGPSKLVKGEDDQLVMDLEVEPGGKYTYYLRYATSMESSAKNLVFYDKIESYSDSNVGPSQWHGKLVGVSAELNTGVAIPATYYISEQDDADQHAFSETDVWTLVDDSTDLSKAVWVAADLGDYEVKPLDIVFVKLEMEAPTSNESDYVKPETYNNYRIKGKLWNLSGDEYTDINNVTNYTVVKYTLKGKVQIEKVNEAGNPIKNVKFTLTGTSKFGDTVNLTVTTDDEGKAVFENLDITGTDGYVLTETVPFGFVVDKTTWDVTIDTDGSSKVDGEDATTAYYRIINKAATEISATKKWINADGTPTPPKNGKITFTLYADGNPTTYTVELDGVIDPNRPAGTGGYEVKEWVALFINLPKYDDDGNEIQYTVLETGKYDGYEPTSTEAVEDGGIIYNKEIVTTVSVVKVWDDNDDQDGIRPDSITFTLYANGTKVSSIVLDGEADNNGEEEAWKATWKSLPKRANGADIVYTVKEEETAELLADYVVIYPDHDERYAVDGEKIINRHETEETTVSVLKTWDDDDDRDGIRPDSITFTLYADGKKVGSIVLDGEVDDDGEKEAWKATWEKLPKKDGGNDIVYTVKEEELGDIRYTVIYPDHEDKYAVDGEEIINRHIIEETEVSVLKTWDDEDDQDGVRPESVEFTLYANGKEVGSITLDGTVDENGEKEAWKATWEKLPVNEGGKPIKYTVKETSEDVNYTVIYPDHEEEYAVDGEEIINKHITEETEVSVLKTWDDKDDQDGIRPDSVTFTLYADGKKVGSIVLDGTVDENGEKEAWKATWEKLPKKAGGKDIVYTVKEEDLGVAGYTVIYPDHEEEYAVDGEEIINRHITEETEVSVIKTWDDKDDQDGVRPASVEFTLYANGKEVGSIVLDGKTDEDGEKEAWKATWEKLPVNEAGKPIKYTVKETSSDVNYTVIYPDHEEEYAVDGEAITNKHVPGTVGVSAKKVWDDNDDQDGIRPASVEFTLYADGTKVSSIVLDGKVDTTGEFEAWVASWKELPEKKDGVTIEYTVKETSTAVDYEVIYEDGKAYAVDGGTITNKHVPETIVLHIEKIWKDDDDRQGKRPATITVNLLADDVVFDTIIIKSDLNGDWHYDSEELPKCKDGKVIKYSITEETVPDYETDITGSAADGFIITNTVGVDTADRTHLPLWIGLMLLSNTSALATALYFKKKEDEE